jgi:hypothetical protein
VKRLIQDREVELQDGRRLISYERFKHLKITEEEKKMIEFIHPSFRIVAIGTPETPKNKFFTSELLSMFSFHYMEELPLQEEFQLVKGIVPPVEDDVVHSLLLLSREIRKHHKEIGMSYSLRQIIRNCRRLSTFKEDDLLELIKNSLLTRFIPDSNFTLLSNIIHNNLSSSGSFSSSSSSLRLSLLPLYFVSESSEEVDKKKQKQKEVNNTQHKEEHRGGNEEHRGGNEHLIPSVEFYETPQHNLILREMLKDFSLKEHLLLVGNQGVGKNKLVDRFLETQRLPRQYIQLHRDTSVQTLTLQPSLRGGRIFWEDSPLVTAVQLGHVLVVDEADKCPLEVVCVLKNLIDGEMLLSDGRKILNLLKYPQLSSDIPKDVIPLHPNFRLIVLANRPGYSLSLFV